MGGQLVISYKLLITEKAGKPLASTRTSLSVSGARELALSLSGCSTPPAQALGRGTPPSPDPWPLLPSALPAAPALPVLGNGLTRCQLPAAARRDRTLLPGLLQTAPLAGMLAGWVLSKGSCWGGWRSRWAGVSAGTANLSKTILGCNSLWLAW